jgi:hypothetical protein
MTEVSYNGHCYTGYKCKSCNFFVKINENLDQSRSNICTNCKNGHNFRYIVTFTPIYGSTKRIFKPKELCIDQLYFNYNDEIMILQLCKLCDFYTKHKKLCSNCNEIVCSKCILFGICSNCEIRKDTENLIEIPKNEYGLQSKYYKSEFKQKTIDSFIDNNSPNLEHVLQSKNWKSKFKQKKIDWFLNK